MVIYASLEPHCPTAMIFSFHLLRMQSHHVTFVTWLYIYG